MPHAPNFVHLHNHTEYSLLDGASRIKAMVKRAAELEMPALALTDHGVMYGGIHFYKACKEAGIKPILGCEVYVAPRSRTLKEGRADRDPYHLTILAKDAEGYRNLMKLCTAGQMEGLYYKPRIDRELLSQHNAGLIVLSGCLGGEVATKITNGDVDGAKETVATYRDIFGPDRYLLEMQRHGIKEQEPVNEALLGFGKEFKLRLAATNDLHYVHADEAEAHDVLLCLQTGNNYDDPNRWRFDSKDFYLKTAEEMSAAFPDLPHALASTLEVADQVDLKLELGHTLLPPYELPEGFTADQYLRKLVEDGVRWRYGHGPEKAVFERMDSELEVISQTGYATYFLIVWDFYHFARSHGIATGPGRGSAAGSLVAYALGITNLDPLRHGLIFERFLNKDRVSMPDIDCDFSVEGRERVIRYVAEKYGADRVAQIITFTTMASKAAIRDVGRVLAVPLKETDRLSKLVPVFQGRSKSLEDAIKEVPEFREAYEGSPELKRLVDVARSLEGVSRNVSTHAAGVVIAPEPLVNYVPLQYGPGKESVITQYDMKAVGEIGLLKMDFLGLQNLDIIATCLRLIKEHRGEEVDMESIPLGDDPKANKAYELLAATDTHGVFQLESAGMRRMLQEMKPQSFEDVTAAVALFRPGPMENIPAYLARKSGRERIELLHPALEPILRDSYGVMIYQEQVMMAARELAGFTLSEADILRAAMGKKDKVKMAQQHEKFVAGCARNGITQQLAEALFEMIAKFASYGFNRCLDGSTRIVNAETGEETTVRDLYVNPREFQIHSLGDDGVIRARAVTAVSANGVKPVYELKTRLGHRIRATDTHRFRAFGGWRRLGDLRPGDLIAAPRRLFTPSTQTWPEHQLVVAAGLIAEGNTCHPTAVYYFNNDKTLVDDFRKAVTAFPDTKADLYMRPEGRWEVRAGRPSRKASGPARSGVFTWAGGLGLLGKKATEKRVPREVFGLRDRDVALFLGRLWSGDGYISGERLDAPFYATSSRGLAEDVQSLLLRFGIVATLHEKRFKYRGGIKSGYAVSLVGELSRERWLVEIGPHCLGREADVAALEKHISLRCLSSADVIPRAVLAQIDVARLQAGLSWKQLAAESGVAVRELYGKGSDGKRGFRHSTVACLANSLQSGELASHVFSDVYWDEIVSITPAGETDTYDLTVETDHNFVAEGIVVHNSHAAAYALVAYQTAYLKANYPLEYMTSLLHHMEGNLDKVATAIVDCKVRGIAVLPPDVNRSREHFTISDGSILFGLAAIKNVGQRACELIVAERDENGPFQDDQDLYDRMSGTQEVNRRVLEALISCGACDSLGERAQLLADLDDRVAVAERNRRDREAGQTSLFGDVIPPVESRRVSVQPMSDEAKLKSEKDLLGLYLSDHPLNRMEKELAKLIDTQAVEVTTELQGSEVRIAGLVREVRRVVTRKGQIMAYAQLEDLTGSVDVILFPRTYELYRNLFELDRVLVVQGKVDARGGGGNRSAAPVPEDEELAAAPEAEEQAEQASIVADFAWNWDDPECVPVERRHTLHVSIPEGDEAAADKLQAALARHPGEDEVFLHFTALGREVVVQAGDRYHVAAGPALAEEIDRSFGSRVTRLETVRPRVSANGNGNGNGRNGNGRGYRNGTGDRG